MNELLYAWIPLYCEDTHSYQWFTNVYKHSKFQTEIFFTKSKLVYVNE